MGWMMTPARFPAERIPSTIINRPGFTSNRRFPSQTLSYKTLLGFILDESQLWEECPTCPLSSGGPVCLWYSSPPGSSQAVGGPDLVPGDKKAPSGDEVAGEWPYLRSIPATQGLSRYL